MTEYRIEAERQLVWLAWGSDPITTERFDAMLARVLADPEYHAGMDFLSDRREAPQAQSTNYVQHLATFFQQHAERLGRCRWAAVVRADSSHDAQFGMARMTEVLASRSPVEFRVFRNVDAALSWLERRT